MISPEKAEISLRVLMEAQAELAGTLLLDFKQQMVLSSLMPPEVDVLKFAGLHFQEHNRMTFYDALAAATLFDDMLCTFESGQVTVEMDDVVQRGVTRFEADRFGRHEIATVVKEWAATVPGLDRC